MKQPTEHEFYHAITFSGQIREEVMDRTHTKYEKKNARRILAGKALKNTIYDI